MTRKAPPSPELVDRIRANIHPAAHPAIDDWFTFSWHRSRETGFPDSDVPHSSQAFCISVWGTLAQPEAGEARRILYCLLDDRALFDRSEVRPLTSLEFTDRSVLNEYGAIPTNVDAFLEYSNLTVAVESKLTEEFGRCSQAKKKHCKGDYGPGSDLKTGTDAHCRLEVADGTRTPRRYLEVMHRQSTEGAYVVGQKCPYAGPGYQVMRNIAFAAEYARRSESDWRVIFAFPAELSTESRSDVAAIVELLKPEYRNQVHSLDYRYLAESFARGNDSTAHDLGIYMMSRLDALGGG
jgi:hypothetical protein